MNKKKIIAMGLSLGMVMNPIATSAAEYTAINDQSETFITEPKEENTDSEENTTESDEKTESEGSEDFSSEAEIKNEDTEENPEQSEVNIESDDENIEDFSAQPDVESDDVEALSTQAETVRVSGTCGENITFQLTTDGVLTLSGSGAMPEIEYDWKYYEPKCGWGTYISSIKKIVIEEGITSISQYSFYDCENLTEVSIPSSINAIGWEAFHWCHNVNKVMIDDLTSWCDIDFDGENANPLRFGADLYVEGEKKTQLIIPNGVTEIKPYAFARAWTNDESKAAIISIQLPDTVTGIGEYAFEYNHLQSVNIPKAVTIIGSTAFAGNDFSTIEIPENVNTINGGAFQNCKNLQKIKIPDAVQKLGAGLFGSCIKLISVELPQGIESIPEAMFSNCTSLVHFSIPETVQVIEDMAFSGCSNLIDIELPNQIHTMGDYTFNQCSSLKKIDLPDELCSIGDNTFMGCTSLTEVSIPNKVMSIGKEAFRKCESVSKITVPDTVTEIGDSAFYGCRMLEQFKIPDSIEAIQDYTFYGCTNLSLVTFSKNLTTIGAYAFQNCSVLVNVVIPDNVTDIGKQTFSGCEKIESVTLPSQITKIDTGLFSGCKSFSEITIPEAVVEIGSTAFQNCSSLKRINFKGDAPQIGVNAFIGVTADCYYPADNATYTLEITTQDWGGDLTWTYEGKTEEENKYKCGENLTWNLTEDGKLVITGSGRMFDYSIDDYQYAPWYEERLKITSIEIDDNVTYIGNYAFYMCNKITDEKTELPEKLEEIGEGAFKNCKIHSVDIPSMVKCVGKEAFAWSGLESVSLPASLQELPERMFAESHYLYDVTFSKGLREIGKEAFYCCFGLSSVDVPEGVTSIAGKAFAWCGAYRSFGTSYSCYNFRKVTLPSTLMTMGASAFSNCQVLQSINIPENITEIQDNMFQNCYQLSNIIIPKNIKKIEKYAFFSNQSLKTITFSWSAPQIDSKAFGSGKSTDTTATCYYPSNNPVWTSSMLQNYGGKLTWVAKEMVKPSEGTGSGGSGSGGTGEGTGSGSSGSDSGTGSGSGAGGSGTGDSGSSGSGGTSGGNTSGGTGTGGNESGGNGTGGTGTGSGSSGSGSGESGNAGGTGTEKEFGFSAHSLTLNGDIGVNFYLELDEEILNDSDAVVEMNVAGIQKTAIKVSDSVKNGFAEVKDTDGNSHKCYKFTCNVYAKQMTDNIVATLKTSSGTWKEVYSVQDYIEKAQNGSNEKLKNLVNAMAVYGGHAQTLLGYNTNDLAGGSLGDVSGVTKDMLTGYEYNQSGTEGNLRFYGSSLLLKEQTSIRMYYQLTGGNIEDYKFAIDGKEVQPVQSGDSNLYYVDLNNIAAQNLEKAHVFTAGNITVSNYSALSYVNKALDSESSSENNKRTAAALYLYWNAAEAYFS